MSTVDAAIDIHTVKRSPEPPRYFLPMIKDGLWTFYWE